MAIPPRIAKRDCTYGTWLMNKKKIIPFELGNTVLCYIPFSHQPDQLISPIAFCTHIRNGGRVSSDSSGSSDNHEELPS
jgi:hypothetical protein